MPRLFLALLPPPDLQAELASRTAQALERDRVEQAFRLTPASAVHLTLCFLGEVAQAQVAALCTTMPTVVRSEAPLALELAATGAFPSLRTARVLWWGVRSRPESRLGEFAGSLRRALLQMGLKPAETGAGPYQGHLSVARARAAPGPLPAHFARLELSADWTAMEVLLLESQLSGAGARYSEVERWSFAAGKTS